MSDAPSVCLIIPCFNEAMRFAAQELDRFPQYLYVLVNDGSSDATGAMLEACRNDRRFVVHLPRNCGKAEAVRQGMLFALDEPTCREAAWLGFWDADFATPLSEVEHLLGYARLFAADPVEAVFGSRVYSMGSRIRRTWYRHLIGRGFATVFRQLFKIQAYDTQCGAKLFRPAAARAAFAVPFVTRWIFDVEILLRLHQARIVECPVREWIDRGGSKLRSPRAWSTIIGDIHRLWRHYPHS
jgi:glycosyltransferase involved in cell wall biosynthesis